MSGQALHSAAEGPKVFISYACEDYLHANAIYGKLRSCGLQPWMDKKSLLPGERWTEIIPRQVKTCDFFLALISPRSCNKQGWVQAEMRLAMTTLAQRPPGVFLIPVRLGECEIPDFRSTDTGLSLQELHWVEYPENCTWTDEDMEPIFCSVERSSQWRRSQRAGPELTGPAPSPVKSTPPSPLRPDLLETMRVREAPFTDEMIDLLRADDELDLRVRAKTAFSAYIESKPGSGLDAFECFLISRHLLDAIRRDDHAACRRKPFIYPIHMYLSSAIRSSEPEEYKLLTETLRKWLSGRARVYETARDFAAFELGMCLCRDALRELLDAVANPFELRMVRYYGAMAIGMIGEPQVAGDLRRIAEQTEDVDLRTVLSHAAHFLETQVTRR